MGAPAGETAADVAAEQAVSAEPDAGLVQAAVEVLGASQERAAVAAQGVVRALDGIQVQAGLRAGWAGTPVQAVLRVGLAGSQVQAGLVGSLELPVAVPGSGA